MPVECDRRVRVLSRAYRRVLVFLVLKVALINVLESMGITGLLPLLKSVQQPVHLSELSGKVIAVDAYVWLHRGVCSCATELATGEPTTK